MIIFRNLKTKIKTTRINFFSQLNIVILFFLAISYSCLRADDVATVVDCVGSSSDLWHNCRGKFRLSNGDEYQGTFKDGKRDGRGVLKKKNGGVYIGNWKKDKPHGAGLEYSENNQNRKEGFWEDGEFVGSTPIANKNKKTNVPESLRHVAILAKPANCNLNIYVYPETVPLTQQSSAKWNGGCDSGDISGLGELHYSWPDGSNCVYFGNFSQGEPKGFFTSKCSLKTGKAEFKGDSRDFGHFFGVLEIEDNYKNKSVFTGESLYLTPNGRGVMRNLSTSMLIDGNFKKGLPSGYVVIEYEKTGERYEGEMLAGKKHGKGIFSSKKDPKKIEGTWLDDKFASHESVDLERLKIAKNDPASTSNIKANLTSAAMGGDGPDLLKNLNISHTEPTAYGDFMVRVEAKASTSSLTINGEEFGPRSDGSYLIKRLAKVGQENQLKIVVKDLNSNTVARSLVVSRTLIDSKPSYAQLNPSAIKQRPEKEAIAIIIGISIYKTLPKAEYANEDARVFYDYAIRALGIKPENIKLLVDDDAEDVEIIKTFKTWLPSRVKSTTDVYVYYSGHGLPTQDGQGLYLLPPRADRDFIPRTAIQFQEINADLQAVKPKSVTIFMDACYSGQGRSGEALVANARPVTLKADKKLFPDNFTVITASQADQISSSSSDLKHGIFSYYLMKGMEGDADANKDGQITLGEMQVYLVENVSRQAGMFSRKQEPQILGDNNKILIGR
jgi:hypothetical protein